MSALSNSMILMGLRGSIVWVLLSFCIVLSGQNIDSSLWNIDLDDIVVTAQYAPTSTKNTVHKVKVINLEKIESKSATNLEQVLQHELNIRIGQDLILGSNLNIQGVSGQNIKIMIDGIPVIGRVGNNIDLSQISMDNIDRIEIIEGPMSVNFGTNALGGVINLISKKSQLRRFQVKGNCKQESISRMNTSLGFGIRLFDPLLLQFSGNYLNFQGFNSNKNDQPGFERTLEWNPKEHYNFKSLMRYDFGNEVQLVYRLSYFNETIDDLGNKRRLSYKPYAFDNYYKTRRIDNSLSFESTILKNYFFQTKLAYNDYKRIKKSIRLDFEDNKSSEIEGAQDTLIYKAATVRSVISSKFNDKKLNFQCGIDLNYDEGIGRKIRDTLFKKAQYSALGDFAIFTSLNYNWNNLIAIQGGLRASYNTKFKSPFVPSLNLKLNLRDNISLRLSYAKGFRAPSLKELFYYFVDLNHYIVGNKNLKPESSDHIQASIAWNVLKSKEQQFILKSGLFYNDISNRISLFDFVIVDGIMVSASKVGKESNQFAYFNQNRFKTLGGDIEFNYKYKDFSIKLGVAPIGRYNLISEEVDEVPNFSYIIESNIEMSYKIPTIDLMINVFIKYNDKLINYYNDFDDAGDSFTNSSILDGYYLMDVDMSKKFYNNRFRLNFGIKNVLNVTQVKSTNSSGGAHSGGVNQRSIAMGRNLYVGVNVNLSWN